MKLVLMYFSPTHSTKKIVARIGKVFFEKLLCETKPVDLTKLAVRMRSCPFDKEDVLVFGAPVYAGRLPVCVSDYIKTLQGNGARAVAVSVYGNRDFDDALLETCDLLTERGFTVCAAGAFIGEHSYTSAVGTGRPIRMIFWRPMRLPLRRMKRLQAELPYERRSPEIFLTNLCRRLVPRQCLPSI